MYIESDANNLIYHLTKQKLTYRSTIKDIEARLKEYSNFYRINKGIIVNMDFVESLVNSGCIVKGEFLSVARSRRKAFAEAFLAQIGR